MTTELGFGTPSGTGTLLAASITASTSSDWYSTIWMYSATASPLERSERELCGTGGPGQRVPCRRTRGVAHAPIGPQRRRGGSSAAGEPPASARVLEEGRANGRGGVARGEVHHHLFVVGRGTQNHRPIVVIVVVGEVPSTGRHSGVGDCRYRRRLPWVGRVPIRERLPARERPLSWSTSEEKALVMDHVVV